MDLEPFSPRRRGQALVGRPGSRAVIGGAGRRAGADWLLGGAVREGRGRRGQGKLWKVRRCSALIGAR